MSASKEKITSAGWCHIFVASIQVCLTLGFTMTVISVCKTQGQRYCLLVAAVREQGAGRRWGRCWDDGLASTRNLRRCFYMSGVKPKTFIAIHS